MTTKQHDAAELAARLAKAYPSLSAYACAERALALLKVERAQRRHAERCCSGEDGGYVKVENGRKVHDPEAEERAGKLIDRKVLHWREELAELVWIARGNDPSKVSSYELTRFAQTGVILQSDPRGPVLLLHLPGEAEAKAV